MGITKMDKDWRWEVCKCDKKENTNCSRCGSSLSSHGVGGAIHWLGQHWNIFCAIQESAELLHDRNLAY